MADATDLFEALEAGLVEGTPTLSLQAGVIWVDGEAAFDARKVLAALTAREAVGPSRLTGVELGPREEEKMRDNNASQSQPCGDGNPYPILPHSSEPSGRVRT